MKLFTATFFAAALGLVAGAALPTINSEVVPELNERDVLEKYTLRRCKHEDQQACEYDTFTAEPGHCFTLAAVWNDVITGVDPGAGNYCEFYHDLGCRGSYLGLAGKPEWNLMTYQQGWHNDKFSSFRCFRI
ncbi:hypothetical protein BJ508DRAFT_333442 [Ascobolus immersus RN42]|uniref:Beta/gamma crystallin 'Greek key' domain-containing protein n=1 Tax=Ascobolus immersus RN42 TaxID=1160509 RepID=A0A3N4HLF5_ASCIM|nr:hypothetical protein BJ508DRAFT_333442 [Ascobolus immersus RN42]